MKYVLIAVWFIGSNSPVPFQVEFASLESCQKAYSILHLEWGKSDNKGRVFGVCVEK